jgi:deoxyribodipyrimidine photo-lyase
VSKAPAIVWLRQDLRLADNPALRAALDTKRPLIVLFILDDETPGHWRIGGASRWWLHHSLEALGADVRKRGGALVLRRGNASELVLAIARETKAEAVFWNRCYEPHAIKRDAAIKEQLRANGVAAESFNGALLFEPWTIKTKTNEPFKVFSPFWRACQHLEPRALVPSPKKVPGPPSEIASDDLASWELLPTKPNWAKSFEPEWRPGEAGAVAALNTFLEERLSAYPEGRDQLGENGASRLSPHLHWGEAPTSSCPRSAGASFRTTFSFTGQRCLRPTGVTSSTRSRGMTMKPRSKRGGVAARVIPSSMLRCVSSGLLATCTIARA